MQKARKPITITVLYLQIGFFICKFRAVSCRMHATKPHFNTLYLVSLLFAPPILHPTNHFLDREVFDLLVHVGPPPPPLTKILHVSAHPWRRFVDYRYCQYMWHITMSQVMQGRSSSVLVTRCVVLYDYSILHFKRRKIYTL